MANTTWNPADHAANIVLSNANLTATWGVTVGLVRSVAQISAGKIYYEVTINTGGAGSADAIGLAAGSVSVTSPSNGTSSPVGTCWVQPSGAMYSDGVSRGTPLGAIPTGSVVCIAFDATARLVWFRAGAAGAWNGAAGNNPATGTGGISMSMTSVYATAWSNLSGHSHVANFGDSAFTGAVPAGFNGGFAPVVATGQARAMVMA